MPFLRSSVVVAIAMLTGAQARAQTATAIDAKVQPPELKPPERASLVGQLSNVAFGPADVERGVFTLPSPFTAPQERGSLLAAVFPSYSPESGVSEWGTGWQASLAIVRMRVQGDIDYATDDLTGPFGRLVKGSDGSWYPLGLSKPVRVVEGTDTLTAYLPDGTKMTFGGRARTATAWGTYAWYLAEVRTPTGRKTRIDWTANASGRLFATSVFYGGVGDDYQYRIDLAYEALPLSFVDYRSRVPLSLDRRVKTVTALSRNAATASFEERWRYEIGYQAEGLGPGFHLTRVQQVFRGGERPPATTYGYNLASTKLASAMLASAPKVAPLLTALNSDALQPTKASPIDLDDDGMPDFEASYDYRLARQGPNGFTFEPLPALPTANANCRGAPSSANAPRTLARMRSGTGDETPYVVDLRNNTYAGTTSLTVCNRLGQTHGLLTVSGLWALGPTVRLVDMNRDHKPDLIRVFSGQYQVLPNTSTRTTFSFGAVRTGVLTPAFIPDTAWAQDLNGDGLPDLIARYASGLVVWYGRGNYAFDAAGQVIRLYATGGGLISNLSTYGLTFIDANKDGLADVLMSSTSSNGTYLFVNRGTHLAQVAVPGLAFIDALTSKPVVYDARGSGNTEVTFTRSGQGLALALDGPETGLMAWADDGKGSVLSFEYRRAPASVGGGPRQAVLARMTVDSSGRGGLAHEFSYGNPKLHTAGRFLIGYGQTQRTDPTGSTSATFLNDDLRAGLPLAAVTRDPSVPGMEKYSESAYEDASYQGIVWKRLVGTRTGWRTIDGTGFDVAEATSVTGWWGEFCPAQVVKKTSSGTLTTDTQFATLAAFAGHFACLAVDTVETGKHPDPTLDFKHETAVSRNEVGLVTRVSSVAGATDLWTLQEASYTPEWLIQTLSGPGQGTQVFEYDPVTRLPVRTTSPEGIVVTVAERDPLTSAATRLTTVRGQLVYEQQFTFDDQERLASTWDNIGSGSRLNPDATYVYSFATPSTPAATLVSRLVDSSTMAVRESVDLLTAGGEPIASGTRIPGGWALGTMTWRDPGMGQTASYAQPSLAGASLVGRDYGALFTGSNLVERTTSGVFGVATEHLSMLHADVARSVAQRLSIDGTTQRLVRTARENGLLDRTSATDGGGNVVTSWDEAGNAWRYVHDVLGRLREVQLPDGKRHRTSYDAHARVSRIARDDVAIVEYGYASVTGFLAEKRFLSPAGALRRVVALVRDSIGRVEREVHTDVATGSSKTFRFYFDGATPAASSAKTTAGLLTAVSGDGYVKRFEYRDDAKLSKRTLDLTGWRTIVTSFSYDEAGARSGHSTEVLAAGTRFTSSSTADHYDAQGRIETQTVGDTTAAYAYELDGRLAVVALKGGTVSFQYDDHTKRQVGSTQTTPANTASTRVWMSARGLPDKEVLRVGTLSLTRQYGYSVQRYLTASTDAAAAYGYAFDGAGLPAQRIENGAETEFVRSGNTLLAGKMTYVFDDLGRTTKRGDLGLEYGPDGQVARATRGVRAWTFIHDETGQRLVKLKDGAPVAAFLPGGHLTASELIEVVRIAGQAVGVLRNGVFEAIPTDLRGTVLADKDGTPRLHSPFGRRDEHPAIAEVLDYVEKGFDADLGLVRMGARYYDPEINRFTVADPLILEQPRTCLENPTACNLYGYARNDPLSYVDPSGLTDTPALDPRIRQVLSRYPEFNDVLIACNNASPRAFEIAIQGAITTNLNEAYKYLGLAGEAFMLRALNDFSRNAAWPTMASPKWISVTTPFGETHWALPDAVVPDLMSVRPQVLLDNTPFLHQLATVNALGPGGYILPRPLKQGTMFLLGEVKAGMRAETVLDGVEKLEAWAKVLRNVPFVFDRIQTELFVDAKVWSQLSPERQQSYFERVEKAGGFIVPVPGLNAGAEHLLQTVYGGARR